MALIEKVTPICLPLGGSPPPPGKAGSQGWVMWRRWSWRRSWEGGGQTPLLGLESNEERRGKCNVSLKECYPIEFSVVVERFCVCTVQNGCEMWLCCQLLSLRPYGLPHGLYQAPLSVGYHRQEDWSELPFSSLGDLPGPGMEPFISCISKWFLYH